MVITGVDHFASVCEAKLVEWYHKHKPSINIARHNVVIVWSSKVLQNYKCLVQRCLMMECMQSIHIMVTKRNYMKMFMRR